MAMTKQQFENWKVKLEEYSGRATAGILFDEPTGCYCALGVLCISEGLNFNYDDIRWRFGWEIHKLESYDPIELVYRVNDNAADSSGADRAFQAVIEFLNENEDKFVGEQV